MKREQAAHPQPITSPSPPSRLWGFVGLVPSSPTDAFYTMHMPATLVLIFILAEISGLWTGPASQGHCDQLMSTAAPSRLGA